MYSSRMTWDREVFWSALAHLTMVINLFTAILGIVAALVFYLAFRRRSAMVAFHALQALLFQLVIWLGAGVVALLLFIIGHALGPIGVFVQIPAFFLSLVPLLGIAVAIFAASVVHRGNEFDYPYAGEWAKKILNR